MGHFPGLGKGMRIVRSLANRIAITSNRPKCAIFVFGCQRSGTGMVMRAFAKSRACRIYNEGKNNAGYDNYRIRSDETIRKLIQASDKPIVVFKPVLDSQHADRLLDLYPSTRAIWIYRDYRDVVASSVKKWQADQRDIMYGIAADIRRDDTHHQYAIYDRMSHETVNLVRKLCKPNMSAEEGAALLWYVRNLIYFELELRNDPRVVLAKYEDLAMQPDTYFAWIFQFIGCHFDRTYVSGVFDSSVKKTALRTIDGDIEMLCCQMMERLDREYSVQLSERFSLTRPRDTEVRSNLKTPQFGARNLTGAG